MRRKTAVAVFSLFLLFMFALPAISEAAFFGLGQKKKIGSATVVKGRVWVTREKEFKSERVKLGTPLYQNDRVRTEDKSNVRIVFMDQSIISIGSKSALTITEYVFDPDKKVRTSRLRLMWGKVKVYANDFMGFRQKKFAVSTNTTIVGVRGTVFLVWIVDDTITKVVSFANEVEVADRFAPEEYVVLQPNQMIEVLAGESVTQQQPFLVTEEQLKILQEGLLDEDQQTTLTTVGTTTEGETTEGETTDGSTTSAETSEGSTTAAETTQGSTTAAETTAGTTTSPTTTTTTSTSTTTTTTTTTSTTTSTTSTTSTSSTLPVWPSPPTTQPLTQLPGFPSTPNN